MDIERNLIISLLRLTKEGSIPKELLKKDAKTSSSVARKLLSKLQNDGLVYVQKGVVKADAQQRLGLAVHAVRLGADIESVTGFLRWQEFEKIAAFAFEKNGYKVHRNFRFKHAEKKREIDLVGYKKPLVVCVDCKHWHHGLHPSELRKIVEKQVERAFALAECLPKLSGRVECSDWDCAKLVPAVLSLVPGRFKFFDDVPIIAVLQLQDFLTQLPAYTNSLKHFSKP